MNNRIIDLMFTTPITVYPTENKDSAGDRVERAPINIHGYVYDETIVITNDLGEKEVSTRQIYLPLDVVSSIKTSYRVSCLDSDKARIIKRQEYRGRRSRTLIGVLYLP